MESVRKQTAPPAEILIVDDGSRVPVTAPVGWSGPPLSIIRTENQGLAAARNEGIQHATTPLVAFLDCDDWWAPSKLEQQESLLALYPEAVACYTRCVSGPGLFPFGPYPPPEVSDSEFIRVLWYNNFFPPSSVLARREVIEQVGLFRTGMLNGEDLELWMRLLQVGRILQVPEPLTYYRVHAGQLTANIFRKVYGMKQARQNIIVHHAEVLLRAGFAPDQLWDAYRNDVLMVYYRRQFGPARQLLWRYWLAHPGDWEILLKAWLSLLPGGLIRRLRGGLPERADPTAVAPPREDWETLVRQLPTVPGGGGL